MNYIPFRTARCGLLETRRSGQRPSSVVRVSGRAGRARTAAGALPVAVRTAVAAWVRTATRVRNAVTAAGRTEPPIAAGTIVVVAVSAVAVA